MSVMIQWRPIASAPKDRPVLVWEGGGLGAYVAEWQDFLRAGWYPTAPSDDPMQLDPTHWAEINPPDE